MSGANVKELVGESTSFLWATLVVLVWINMESKKFNIIFPNYVGAIDSDTNLMVIPILVCMEAPKIRLAYTWFPLTSLKCLLSLCFTDSKMIHVVKLVSSAKKQSVSLSEKKWQLTSTLYRSFETPQTIFSNPDELPFTETNPLLLEA